MRAVDNMTNVPSLTAVDYTARGNNLTNNASIAAPISILANVVSALKATGTANGENAAAAAAAAEAETETESTRMTATTVLQIQARVCQSSSV